MLGLFYASFPTSLDRIKGNIFFLLEYHKKNIMSIKVSKTLTFFLTLVFFIAILAIKINENKRR